MIIKLLAFGIAKEIFDAPTLSVTLPEGAAVKDLKQLLETNYPKLKDLAAFMIAVNNRYASPSDIINAQDEIAIIPPVSGG